MTARKSYLDRCAGCKLFRLGEEMGKEYYQSSCEKRSSLVTASRKSCTMFEPEPFKYHCSCGTFKESWYKYCPECGKALKESVDTKSLEKLTGQKWGRE